MDVRCPRCSTEYDFDDALVSEQGTNVRCTNCAHQFRIHPARGAAPERWVIRKGNGETLTFLSLRELQRAIGQRLIGPDDMLSRGAGGFRPLKTIAELEQFFYANQPNRDLRKQGGTDPGGIGAGRSRGGTDPGGIGRPAAPAQAMGRSGGGTLLGINQDGPVPTTPSPQNFSQRQKGQTIPTGQFIRRRERVLTPAATPYAMRQMTPPTDPTGGFESVDEQATIPRNPAPSEPEHTTVPLNPQPDPPTNPINPLPRTSLDELSQAAQLGFAATAPQQPGVQLPDLSVGLEDAVQDLRSMSSQQMSSQPLAATTPSAQPPPAPAPAPEVAIQEAPSAAAPHSTEPVTESREAESLQYDYPGETTDAQYVPPVAQKGRPGLRWIVAFMFIGVCVLLAMTVGRAYFDQVVARVAPNAVKGDERVQGLLTKGRKFLAEADLEAAKAEFDKASVLAENDPEVIGALASVEATRADLLWLEWRLLPESEKEKRDEVERQLHERNKKLESALAPAKNIASPPPTLIAARVDHLRMSGRQSDARSAVGPLSKHASQPEIAYVLAALDLAEEKPGWSSVIDRLRTAARAELAPGRASAALIYALGKSGQSAEAREEFKQLEARSKPHPLQRALRAFVAGLPGEDEEEVSEGTEVAAEGAAGAAASEPAAAEVGGEEVAAGSELPAGDFRRALEQASAAKQSGDLSRAQTLYNSVLSSQPGNVEAMAGLGDIERQRGNNATALSHYQNVLARNPSYLPAMMGSADIHWATGNRSRAVEIYRKIVDRVGDSSYYGARAQQRIVEHTGGSGHAPSQPIPTEEPVQPSPDPTPHIDTTDLQ